MKTKNDDGAAVAGRKTKHLNVVTARQRSCGKVMFSLVSVILSRRASMPGPEWYAWSQVPSGGWVCLVPDPFQGVEVGD